MDPLKPRPPRARFEFAARTHRENSLRYCAYIDRFSVARELISRDALCCQEKTDIQSIFLGESYFVAFFPSGKTMFRGCSPLRRHSSMYSTR
jgi:hypothetical protein